VAEKVVVQSLLGAFIILKNPKFGDSKAYDVNLCDWPIMSTLKKNVFFFNIESQIKGGSILDSSIVQKY
jgi:hypothetical protein